MTRVTRDTHVATTVGRIESNLINEDDKFVKTKQNIVKFNTIFVILENVVIGVV